MRAPRVLTQLWCSTKRPEKCKFIKDAENHPRLPSYVQKAANMCIFVIKWLNLYNSKYHIRDRTFRLCWKDESGFQCRNEIKQPKLVGCTSPMDHRI